MTGIENLSHGLIRSLLFTTLSGCPILISDAINRKWAKTKDCLRLENRPRSFTENEIKEGFNNLVKDNAGFATHRFALLIVSFYESTPRNLETCQRGGIAMRVK